MTDAQTGSHPQSVSSAALQAPAPPVPTLSPIELPGLGRAAARARSFRALYEAHVAFVWRNLRRLGVHESDVEDRTQEVFVVAHRRFDDFEDRGHGPRAWLFQIVLRIASDARRHRRRHPEDPDGGDVASRAVVDASQADALARREALSKLDAALETIDVGRRAVIVLHEIEEMTAPEIAEVLGIPMNTVYSRLRVARVELEEALALQQGDE
ncbi:MAG: RNA polymerase sigma factor [Myxococcota bacterium]|nr:RNA polymerase sigma factor [Myxococcota bacterium]